MADQQLLDKLIMMIGKVRPDLVEHLDTRTMTADQVLTILLEALTDDVESPSIPPPANTQSTRFQGSQSRVVRIMVGRDPLEKAEAALGKLLAPQLVKTSVPAFKSLLEAYIHLTGDKEFRNVPTGFERQNLSMELRARQDVNSATWPNTLQNILNLMLANDYWQAPYHEEALISQRHQVNNLRDVHLIQLSQFDDLPDIDPEAALYSEMGPIQDGESAFSMRQKGAVLWLTRKVVIMDDIRAVQALVSRVARAARRAHARFVWNFWNNNANCSDGTAWFTAGHGNLGSTALSFTSATAAITALAEMTEPAPSTALMGIDFASFLWSLIVPVQLWDTGVTANTSEEYYTANDLTSKVANPLCELFGEKSERVIVNPFATSVKDWGVLRGPGEVPIVEMAYLYGKQDPMFTIADEPVSESVFRGDKIGYKCLHEYGGGLVDYRGGYKAVVP